MPSGPESFVAHPRYTQEFTRARELLLAHPGPLAGHLSLRRGRDWCRVGSRPSAPPVGVRIPGHGAQGGGTRPNRGVAHDYARARDRHGHWGQLARVVCRSSVSGHRPGPPRVPAYRSPPPCPAHVAFVNPLDWGVDGMSEMCASTLTWLFSVFLDPANWDNAVWGLSGAIHDRGSTSVGSAGSTRRSWTRRSAARSSPGAAASPFSARPSGRRSGAA